MREYFRKLARVFRSPGLAAVWRWSEGVRGRIALMTLMTAVSTLASLGLTLSVRGLVDAAASTDPGGLKHFGILCGALIALDYRFFLGGGLVRIHTDSLLQKKMQRLLVDEIVSKEYSKIRPYHSGELVNRVFSDMTIIKNGMMDLVSKLAYMVISFTGAALILISMDWHFVILIVLGSMLGALVLLVFRGPMKRRHRILQEASDGVHASAQEVLENIRLIKASGSERRVLPRFYGAQERLQKAQIGKETVRFAMDGGMDLLFSISWVLCMGWGCIQIFRGQLTYGTLAAMIQLIGRIQQPIVNAVGIAGEAYGVVTSAERVLELTELPDEKEEEPLKDFDEIVLEDVGFRYDDGTEDVLKGADTVFRRGSFTALTGTSGGGKTTLFYLLLGLFVPTAGRLYFRSGGEEIPASGRTRGLFAYVPQGNTLFSGTLRDNLTMFTDGAEDAQIMEAAKAACIDTVVAEMGLDAVIGERGKGLSEGQAQRLAIARAILSGAPILLLDEATSALDEETEARVLENISGMRDRTCIIVTHRKAALRICERSLHMEEGKLAEKRKESSGGQFR